MRKLVFSLLILLLCFGVYGQEFEKQPIADFDQERGGIPQGNIDTITYKSQTVDTVRRAIDLKTPMSFY